MTARLLWSRCLLPLALWLLWGCEKAPEAERSSTLTLLYQGQQQQLPAQGRWLLVNYWAIWCKPCIKEIPELNALQAQHPELRVLGVNYDRPPLPLLQAQADKLAIGFPLLLSDPAGLGLQVPNLLPTSYLLDPSGRLVKTLRGPQTAGAIEALLTEVGF